jgi:hypothetical protein
MALVKVERWDWITDVAGALRSHPGEIRRLPLWLRHYGQRTRPLDIGLPWWPYHVISHVESNLGPGSRVFEYGCGASTLWLSSRAAYVHSVEHVADWHRQVRERVGDSVIIDLIEPAQHGTMRTDSCPGAFDAYVAAIRSEPNGSFDLVIVDGRCRMDCLRMSAGKVRPGGMMLLDDSNRTGYQPAAELLAGWERHDFGGLKPGGAAQTSIWLAPEGAGGHQASRRRTRTRLMARAAPA